VQSNKDAVIDKQTYALNLDGSNADKPVRITKATAGTIRHLRPQRQDLRRHLLRSEDPAASVDPPPTVRWSSGSSITS
jgi:hypothetical protein